MYDNTQAHATLPAVQRVPSGTTQCRDEDVPVGLQWRVDSDNCIDRATQLWQHNPCFAVFYFIFEQKQTNEHHKLKCPFLGTRDWNRNRDFNNNNFCTPLGKNHVANNVL